VRVESRDYVADVAECHGVTDASSRW
jgi:hypothetical protein